MRMALNRDVFFTEVRDDPFPGTLTQSQVEGLNRLLDVWETEYADCDLRWLAYDLATGYHETGAEMMPVEEYGKGEGMKYGSPDPETGETYYGRGDVQCTWRENYARLDKEFGLTGDDSCEWHADNALDPIISAKALFQGSIDGWYRSDDQGKQTLARYFNAQDDDPFGAREIINGDKNKIPSWSNGKKIGDLIAEYYDGFLYALRKAYDAGTVETAPAEQIVTIHIAAPPGVKVVVDIQGED